MEKSVDTVSMSEQINRRSSSCFTRDFPGSGRRSLSFHDISTGDFGRESMGILPPDFGKDSIGFMNISSSELGKESLWKEIVETTQISEQVNRRSSICFKTDYPGTSGWSLSLRDLSTGDFGRESMGILPPDFGKDLLGFMNISSSEFGRESLWKETVDAMPVSEQINPKSSICFTRDCPGTGRQSLSLRDTSTGDFGRESIGILPPDFGRGSLGFMNISSSELGRESLGILQINALKDSFSFRRESFGIHNLADFGRESIDCGRESLGILHLRSPDFKFPDEDKKVPDILLSTIDEGSDYLYNTLDTGFLVPHSRKSSAVSSTGSSVNPSFNSNSLEEPSKIYSLSSSKHLENNKSNLFNIACSNTELRNLAYSNNSEMSSIHSPLNRGRIFSSSEVLNSRSRIQSLPESLKDKCHPTDETEFKHPAERKCWSTDKTMRTKGLENRSFHGTLNFEDTDTSSDFRDSVFIEGHHFAEKIADGSLLNQSSGEIGTLDSTPQPKWPNELSENEDKSKEIPKCDTETIFKTVDKMLPPPVRNNINYKLKTSRSDSDSSNENSGDKSNLSESNSGHSQSSEKNISKLLQNLSNISHESNKLSISRKIKDPKEILQNLSEILNCTNRSDQQKSAGQNLLSSLADILSENKSNMKTTSLDDSGHSSINEQAESPNKDNHVCFEVFDLCTKNPDKKVSNEDISNKDEVLDMCIKAEPKKVLDKRHSKSFSSSIPNLKTLPSNIIQKKNTSVSGLDFNKNKIPTSNSSVNSNTSKNSNLSKPSIAGKLRQKSINPGTKKGPLKAVIPIGDMKKKKDIVTPERTEQKIPLSMQSKRTSTPIHEPKLKPMAASTPSLRSMKSQKNSGATSVARPKIAGVSSNISKNMSNAPTALPKSSTNIDPKLLRRNSVSEFKRTSEGFSKLQRSNSIEKGTGIISSLSKVRQGIVKLQNTLKENNNIAENKGEILGNKRLPIRKSTDSEHNLKQIPKLSSNKEHIYKSSILYSKKAVASQNTKEDQNHDSSSQLHFARNKESSCKSRDLLTNSTDSNSKRRNSLGNSSLQLHFSRNKESPCKSRNLLTNSTDSSSKRRNSLENKTGMMSSLVAIRQNILNSPHFQLRSEEKSNINNLLQDISENKLPLRINKELRLGKETVLFSKPKKADKENIEK